MGHGTLHFQGFDEFLNTDDFFPHIEKEYANLGSTITDSDLMSNIHVRRFECGMCLTFDFRRVRGFGMRKKNIVAIEAAIRNYIDRIPTGSNEKEDMNDKPETEVEDKHPLEKIKNRVDKAINSSNFQLANELLDLYNKYRDTLGPNAV